MSELGVYFDLSAITVGEWIRHVETVRGGTGLVEYWCEFLATVVSELPKGWGNPRTPKTYREMKHFEQFEPLKDAFNEAVKLARDVAKPVDIDFNLDAITMAEWAEHEEAIQIVPGKTLHDILSHWWGFLPQVIAAWPAEWGDKDDPGVYVNLCHFTQFEPMLTAFRVAVADTRKKVTKKPIKAR